MIIERVDVYHVAKPLIYPFRTAFSDEDCIESILVLLSSGNACGWAETSPWRAPLYSSEWARGAFLMVRDWLAPLLVGRDIASGAELQQALAAIKGNSFAKASLDLAWWDLHARQLSLPLWQVLGGQGPTVAVGADLGVMHSIEALLDEIAKVQAAGFRRLKLKYRPGWDLNMIAAVRKAYPDMVIHVDCNSAYSLADLEMFQELDQYELAMIEQPLAHDDLLDHARLQAAIRTPICLDESIVSLAKARKAIDLKACRWINIKVARVGGLTSALAIHDYCQAAGVPCWVGSMVDSAVGQGPNIALATLPNIRYPSDIFPTDRFFSNDLGEPEIVLSGPSEVTAPPGPGTGFEPNPERLASLQLDHATLS